MNDLLNADLAFTFAALKKHPKTYAIWNHRRWCLECIPDAPLNTDSGVDVEKWRKEAWTQEMFIVERLLDADARNCASAFPPPFPLYPVPYGILTEHCSPCMGLQEVHPARLPSLDAAF